MRKYQGHRCKCTALHLAAGTPVVCILHSSRTELKKKPKVVDNFNSV
jgi:hypothetical protein